MSGAAQMALLAFAAAASVGAAAELRLGAPDAGSTVTAHVGDTLSVALRGNPTTGYS
jgi:hypothetical protein